MEGIKEEVFKLNREMERLRDFLGYFDTLIEEESRLIGEEYEGGLGLLVDELNENIRKIKNERSSYDASNLDIISHVEEGDNRKGYDIYVDTPDDIEDKGEINYIISRLEYVSEKRDILYQSVIMNLVGQVEAYFSDLIKFYYENIDMKVDSNKDRFSLEDIKKIDSVKDAEDRVISKEIDSVLSGPFSAWIEGMKEELGIGMGYANPRMEECREAYQRRNIVVHNDGLIDRDYIDKSSDEYRYDDEVGKSVYITKDYLMRKIDLFQSLCILAGLDIWKTEKLEDEERAVFTDKLIDIFSKKENEYISGSLGKFQMMDRNMPLPYRRMGKFNFWHLKKERGEWEEVEEDVREEDVSGMDSRIKSCYYAITENIEDLADSLESAFITGDISPDGVETYPVFKNVRDEDEIQEILSKYK